MTDTRDSFEKVIAEMRERVSSIVGGYVILDEISTWADRLTALQAGAGDARNAARYKFAFEHCYGLLDDIDTAGDVAKDDDKLYRQIVENTHIKRLKFSGSDGYAITIKAQALDNAQATEGK